MKEYKQFLIDDDLNIYNKKTHVRLNPFVGSDGYMQVACRIDGKRYYERVHKIVAECFIENTNKYKYINHIDSDKTNNSISNLEWCTNSENVAHGWHSGNRTHRNNTCVYVTDLCGAPIGIYKSIRQCAEMLSLDRHKIARVLKGELRNDYLNYLFYYMQDQTTIEMVSVA